MGDCLSRPGQSDRGSHPLGQLPSGTSGSPSGHDQQASNGSLGQDMAVVPEDVTVKIPTRELPDIPVDVPSTRDGYIVRALYDFQAVNQDDLSFKKGDRMKTDESTLELDWWLVTHMQSGKFGYIPSNYVYKDDNSPQAQDWWFSSDRDEAVLMLLLPGNSNGTFLIREAHDKKTFALSVREENPCTGNPSVRHYRIKKLDNGGYYISPKQPFADLFALIEYYSCNVGHGLCTVLSQPCPRLKPALQLKFCDLEIKRSAITLDTQLGQGHFGEVWKGKLNGTADVAIKTLKKGSMSPADFLREAEIMHKMRHKKLVTLLAVCSKNEPIWIITELMANGSLLDYLRKDGTPQIVKFPMLVKMAAQIADGMQYLEAQNFIHRDLRAANVLVGEHHDVKVADFGLARILDDDEVYDASDSAKFPIKWTAPEAGLYRKFSIKSDVWSFGILLYELFTYGRVPYPGMPGNSVLSKVEKGYRMSKPAGSPGGIVCPDPIYDTMMKCWKRRPEERPTFEYLKEYFDCYDVCSEGSYAEGV